MCKDETDMRDHTNYDTSYTVDTLRHEVYDLFILIHLACGWFTVLPSSNLPTVLLHLF